MILQEITTDMIGSFGYQSRRQNTLDEDYGFSTREEAVQASMGFYKGWNTLIVEIVEGEFDGQISFRHVQKEQQ